MRALSWVVVAAVGWRVMVAAYTSRAQPDPKAPWGHGLVVIGPELTAEVAHTGKVISVRVRLLPAIERTEAILKVMSQVATGKAANLESQLRPKLILLPSDATGIDASSLQSGRLPEAGRDQVIAGASAAHKDRVTAGDRVLDVVGVLKPESALLRDDYLIPASDAATALFPENDSSVHAATLVELTSEQFRDRKVLQQLEKSLPAPKYTMLMPAERLEPQAFYVYLGGLAAFLLGGSGALIGLFRTLAAKARKPAPAGVDDLLDSAGRVAHEQGAAKLVGGTAFGDGATAPVNLGRALGVFWARDRRLISGL